MNMCMFVCLVLYILYVLYYFIIEDIRQYHTVQDTQSCKLYTDVLTDTQYKTYDNIYRTRHTNIQTFIRMFSFCLFMVFSATCNNISVISCRSILLMEKTGVPVENPRPVASQWELLKQIQTNKQNENISMKLCMHMSCIYIVSAHAT
jgi:hypothetical protein